MFDTYSDIAAVLMIVCVVAMIVCAIVNIFWDPSPRTQDKHDGKLDPETIAHIRRAHGQILACIDRQRQEILRLRKQIAEMAKEYSELADEAAEMYGDLAEIHEQEREEAEEEAEATCDGNCLLCNVTEEGCGREIVVPDELPAPYKGDYFDDCFNNEGPHEALCVCIRCAPVF